VAGSVATVAVALAVVVGCAACSGAAPIGSAATTTTTVAPSGSPPLSAPKTSVAQDARFFTDVAEADPTLATYQQAQGNVALRALLTDGSAFCALLPRHGGIRGQ
jgi:hypothetical protein